MILPRVKRESTGENTVRLPRRICLTAPAAHRESAARLLSLFLPQCVVVDDGEVSLTALPEDEIGEEAYRLRIADGRVELAYADYAGLRNGLATFSLLACVRDDRLVLTDTEIEDCPSVKHRGVMLDLARGVKDLEELKQDMVLIAKARFNVLHLHLADGSGVCFRMEALPEDCYLKNAYTREQMRELIAFAGLLGLLIIPEYDMPAHSDTLLRVFPQFCCETDAPKPHSRFVTCTATPEVYPLFEAIIRELADLFPGPYIHVGGDELDFADVPQFGALCHWNSCKKCAAFRRKHGLADRQEQYYFFMNRIYEYVKSTGRTMIMWSDQIDCTRPAGMPQDIIMEFWRVAAEGRGPHHGCSMNGQLAMGYTIINSWYPHLYGDEEEYLSSENLRTWRNYAAPACDEAYRGQIIGDEVCFWNYGDKAAKFAHYAHSLPSAVILTGDKLWNHDDLPYSEEYGCALTRAVLGAGTPDKLNVFSAIGDLLPPRTEKPAYAERVTLSNEELADVLALLTEDRYTGGERRRADAYANCVRYVMGKR